MLTDTDTRMLLARERQAQLARSAAAGLPLARPSWRWRRPRLHRPPARAVPAKLSWRT